MQEDNCDSIASPSKIIIFFFLNLMHSNYYITLRKDIF